MYYIPICIQIYTHRQLHQVVKTLRVKGWTSWAPPSCGILSISGWKHSSEILVHVDITQLLQICLVHIYDADLPFHHIPEVLYWIEIM